MSGKQGSGKTTVATRLRELAELAGYAPRRFRFAAPLYEMHDAVLPIMKHYNLVAQDCDKEGAFLQLLGTEWGRMKKGVDCWAKIAREQVDLLFSRETTHPYFITIEDARFENEFSIFPDAFRVRLNCPKETRRMRTHGWRDNDQHPSEIGLDNFAALGLFDYYLETADNFEAGCLAIMQKATEFQGAGRKIETIRLLRAMKEGVLL